MIDASKFVEIILAQVFPVIKSSSAHFNKIFAGYHPALYNRILKCVPKKGFQIPGQNGLQSLLIH